MGTSIKTSVTHHYKMSCTKQNAQINFRLVDGKKYHDCHRRKSGLQDIPGGQCSILFYSHIYIRRHSQ